MGETTYDDDLPVLDEAREPGQARGRDDDLPAWLTRAARAVPRLSREEERALGERVTAADGGAADHLVEANLRLVFKVAGRFRWTGLPFDDLVQEGMLGLIHAARGFHPNGTAFSTYAVACVEGAIRRGLREQGRVVRLPHYLEDRISQVRRASARLEQRDGVPPTDGDLAAELGWPVARVRAVRAAEVATQRVSLDAPIDGVDGGDGGRGVNLASLLVDEGVGPDEAAEEQEARAWLGVAVAALPSREGEVLSLRYGPRGDNPLTMAEVGTRLGCSRQRVEQIERQAIERVRRLVGRFQATKTKSPPQSTSRATDARHSDIA
jgi:RNA polymerase sigma factor (sigma-70 family)